MKRNIKRDFQIRISVSLIPKEKGDNMTDVNNNSINGIVQGFSDSNAITRAICKYRHRHLGISIGIGIGISISIAKMFSLPY